MLTPLPFALRREAADIRSAASSVTVKSGDMIACGIRGIRIKPESKERDREEFASHEQRGRSERRVRIAVKKIAQTIIDKRKNAAASSASRSAPSFYIRAAPSISPA